MVVLVFINCSRKSPSSEESLFKYIPAEAESGAWKKDGSPQEYKGEDLFLYIDGGADIYREYGFKQVVVQDFLSKKGRSLSLEIFEMTSPESAYGIYTFKTHSGGKALALGDEAQLADYYLNFWKGNFLVTITGFNEDEETAKGLEEIGMAVDKKIASREKRPALVSMLLEKGLIPSSLKYFRGNLGLYNSYPFFTEDIFAFQEGVKGDYEDGYSLYIIPYPTQEECQSRLYDAEIKFKQGQRYKSYTSLGQSLFRVEDGKGNSIFVSHHERYLLIVLGKMGQAQAREIVASVRENIK